MLQGGITDKSRRGGEPISVDNERRDNSDAEKEQNERPPPPRHVPYRRLRKQAFMDRNGRCGLPETDENKKRLDDDGGREGSCV